MLPHLLSLLTPKRLGVGLVVTVLGLALLSFRCQLSSVRAELAQEQSEHQACLLEAAELAGNRDRLKAALEEQSAAVSGLVSQARQMEAESALRAARTLQAGELRRRAILSSDGGVGPEEVNRWMRESFSSSP